MLEGGVRRGERKDKILQDHVIGFVAQNPKLKGRKIQGVTKT